MIEKIQQRIEKLNDIGQQSFNGNDYSFGFNTWQAGTITLLTKLFRNEQNIINQIQDINLRKVSIEKTDASAYNIEACKAEAKEILNVLMDSIPKEQDNSQTVNVDFWELLHPRVKNLAKTRFDNELYADSVSVCLREINLIVKNFVRNAINQELDGAPLMTRAFSANAPLISFADLTTENGRNIQLGYMKIFEGAMIGIRNPKAHINMHPDRSKAVHLLFLSSFMFVKLQEAGITISED